MTYTLIRSVGALLLVVGAISAILGPAETHVFSMFREGGRFHFEGFGFGSLMFASIAIQIAGYYVIAVLCIPLGLGHLRLRWWVRPAMTTLLTDWLIVGLPLSFLALAMLVTSKVLTVASLLIVALGFVLLYPVLPILLLRFYRSQATRFAFGSTNKSTDWLSVTPPRIRVAASLLVLLALILHFPLFLGGLFPLFGAVADGLLGTLLIDFSIISVIILACGVGRKSPLAWWCTLVFLGLLTASSTITLLTVTPAEILAIIPLAPVEFEAVSLIPMRGFHLVLVTGIMPVVTLIAVAVSRRDFAGGLYSKA